MAATRAAERGRRTILLDKNREPGVKILISGGTRCNLTHATDARGVVEAFGPNGRFLHSALAALGPQQVVELFEAEGVPTKVEPNGKVFPASDKAADVRAALVQRAKRSGCTLALGETLVDIARTDAGFQLTTEGGTSLSSEGRGGTGTTPRNPLDHATQNEQIASLASQHTVIAQKLILATGGQSYPACGTTGDGYRWAAALGHRIVPPHTALVPVTSHAPWVLALQGITLPDVVVAVVDIQASPAQKRRSNVLASRRGALLFAHFGVTGPAVMDVSHAISGSDHPNSLLLRCDLLPNITEAQLDALLGNEIAAGGKRRVATLLDPWLPHRVGETLLTLIGVPLDRPMAELSKANRRQLAQTAKQLDIPASGTMGFRKAELTAGGIALDEVDSRTMQSRIVPGLFFAGELLDLNGPVGGFNFQAAFSTGWLAGESV